MNGQPEMLDCLGVLRMDDTRNVVTLAAELESDRQIRAMIATSTSRADGDMQSFPLLKSVAA